LTNLATAILANDGIDPAREAIAFAGERWTHAQFAERVRRLANGLKAQGVAPGDRVCVLLTNCPQFLESFFAITAIGALYVPLNTLLTPREHMLLLGDCRPAALISSSGFADTIAAAEALDSIRSVILTKGAADSRIDYETLLASASDADPLLAVAPDADAAIVYTSGTTSLPKGVVLTHSGYLADWHNLAAVLAPTADSVNLQIAPLYHAAIVHSLLHLVHGARTILAPKFEPGFVLRTIGEERVTHLFCVPTIIYDLLDHPDFRRTDFSSLRTLEYGAAPMTRSRLEDALATIGRPVFVHAYGMTETTSHCCTLGGVEHNEVLGSIGHPMQLCEMMIADDEGREVPHGTVGEMLVRGPNIMSRYWGRESETAAALQGGWLHTGDLGRRDARGYYYIVDRKKDMIISGGVNIYPKDVEEVIAQDPAVAEVAVYGAPHPRWGEAVAAAIRLKPGASLDRDALQAMMESRLGRHMLPKQVEVVDDFPRNGTGKIMKHVLRRRAAEATAA
jgi:acyl-CoA synthetase (AMP-forming)/AMP-acid ligase II